jgi:hypothetical protein
VVHQLFLRDAQLLDDLGSERVLEHELGGKGLLAHDGDIGETRGLSVDRLMTQLEMMTSTELRVCISGRVFHAVHKLNGRVKGTGSDPFKKSGYCAKIIKGWGKDNAR